MANSSLIYILFLAAATASLQLLSFVSWEISEAKDSTEHTERHVLLLQEPCSSADSRCNEMFDCSIDVIDGETSTLVSLFTLPLRLRVVDCLTSMIEGAVLVARCACGEKEGGVREERDAKYTIRLAGSIPFFLVSLLYNCPEFESRQKNTEK